MRELILFVVSSKVEGYDIYGSKTFQDRIVALDMDTAKLRAEMLRRGRVTYIREVGPVYVQK